VEKAPDAFRTISEVAEELDLPQHVLRFWETRFSHIRPMKRGGGRRYYRPDDVDLLRGIRHLLYGEGYTIRGVQRILKDEGVRFVQVVWKTGAPQPAEDVEDEEAEDGEIEPGRGLLGLWPSLLGGSDQSDDDEEATEVHAGEDLVRASSEREVAPQMADVDAAALLRPEVEPAVRELPRDDLRKLKATLGELSECRRLIEAALRDEVDVTSFGES
jgi:DNA-binding transcriptional MerR regulator